MRTSQFYNGWLPLLALIVVAIAGMFIVYAETRQPIPPSGERPLFYVESTSHSGNRVWICSKPLIDSTGVWAWRDVDANLIVVAVTGERSRTRTNALQADASSVTVKIGPDTNDLYLTFYRIVGMRDRMLIVLPDGRATWIPLQCEQTSILWKELESSRAFLPAIIAHLRSRSDTRELKIIDSMRQWSQ